MPSSEGSLSRRRFLESAACCGAGALLLKGAAPAKPHRIDVHHHLSPPNYVAAVRVKNQLQGPTAGWTVAKAIEDMDQAIAEERRAFGFQLLQVEYTHLAAHGGDILVEHDVTFDLFGQIARRERTLLAGPEGEAVELGPGDYLRYPSDVLHVFDALEPDTSGIIIMEHV